MTVPLQVTFHGVADSDALRAQIAEHTRKLERFCDGAIACHAVVERSEGHRHKGNRYRVHLHLSVPGREFDAGSTPRGDRTHEDVYVAVRDAFDALRRQVEEYLRIRRGEIKAHAETGGA